MQRRLIPLNGRAADRLRCRAKLPTRNRGGEELDAVRQGDRDEVETRIRERQGFGIELHVTQAAHQAGVDVERHFKPREAVRSHSFGGGFGPLEDQVRRNMEMFEKTFAMFTPFARGEKGAAVPGAPRADAGAATRREPERRSLRAPASGTGGRPGCSSLAVAAARACSAVTPASSERVAAGAAPSVARDR